MCLLLVGALALIREPLGLWDGHASVMNAYLGDIRLELKGDDEAVEAADDKSLLSVYQGTDMGEVRLELKKNEKLLMTSPRGILLSVDYGTELGEGKRW